MCGSAGEAELESVREDLMGYYNPIEQRFHSRNFSPGLAGCGPLSPTSRISFVWTEMNLARVEYYFADFLSLLRVARFLPWIHLYGTQEEQPNRAG